jgi:CubicO group peptidase (beta-lactamase class C family)
MARARSEGLCAVAIYIVDAMTAYARGSVIALVAVAGCTPAPAAPATPAPSASWAPTAAPTGPDADSYGRADGYPVGTPETFTEQRYLVGTFSHFDQVFPVHRVARSSAVSPLKRAPAEAAIHYDVGGERRSLQDYLDHNPVTGLLVAHDDTILYEHYQYGRGPADRFLSQSMGKTFTAMLVGVAIAEGAIRSVDDRAEEYVAELRGSEYGKTSIRDLLHMASGLRFTEDYGGADDDERFERSLLFADPARPLAPADTLRPFDQREAPPNTRWNYAATQPYVLGLVLRAATGKTLAAYLHEKIWAPMGAEADAAWTVDGSGHELAHGFVQATLRDYARFGLLLAHDGAWHGRQLIPKQWVLDATTVAADFLAPGHLIPGAKDFDLGYGYFTWIVLPGPERRIFALMGTRGQIILIDSQTHLVIVQTAVRKHFVEPWYEFFAVMRGALRYVSSK